MHSIISLLLLVLRNALISFENCSNQFMCLLRFANHQSAFGQLNDITGSFPTISEINKLNGDNSLYLFLAMKCVNEPCIWIIIKILFFLFDCFFGFTFRLIQNGWWSHAISLFHFLFSIYLMLICTCCQVLFLLVMRTLLATIFDAFKAGFVIFFRLLLLEFFNYFDHFWFFSFLFEIKWTVFLWKEKRTWSLLKSDDDRNKIQTKKNKSFRFSAS